MSDDAAADDTPAAAVRANRVVMAHGSGGRRCNLASLYLSPAGTGGVACAAAKIVPCMFRILLGGDQAARHAGDRYRVKVPVPLPVALVSMRPWARTSSGPPMTPTWRATRHFRSHDPVLPLRPEPAGRR